MSSEKSGPHQADCLWCPAFATGYSRTALTMFGKLHEIRTGHEVWVGQRMRPASEFAPDGKADE